MKLWNDLRLIVARFSRTNPVRFTQDEYDVVFKSAVWMGLKRALSSDMNSLFNIAMNPDVGERDKRDAVNYIHAFQIVLGKEDSLKAYIVEHLSDEDRQTRHAVGEILQRIDALLAEEKGDQ